MAVSPVLFGGALDAAHAAPTWTVNPSYASAISSTAVTVTDDHGTSRKLYNRSYAVLILEGTYQHAPFDRVTVPAAQAERLLRSQLEMRGFQVLEWKDLASNQLWTVLREVFNDLGYQDNNSRLFFYYFGHGWTIGTDSDAIPPKTFLVPIDAPNPATDEVAFEKSAIPIEFIVTFSGTSAFKHEFLAFEACKAGAIVSSLGGPPQADYVLNPRVQEQVRQFLTAGSDSQDIAADNAFTHVLVDALSDKAADAGSGYIMGSDVINYVLKNLPRSANRLSPEHGTLPHSSHGDFMFGALNPQNPRPIPVTAQPAVISAGQHLIVETQPSHAEVYVDGIFVGASPVNLANLSATTHTIRLAEAGYQTREFPVLLPQGQTVLSNVSLQAIAPPQVPTSRLTETLTSRKELRGIYWDGSSAGKIQADLRKQVDADLAQQCRVLGGILQATDYGSECDSNDKDDCVYDGGVIASHLTCKCEATARCLIRH